MKKGDARRQQILERLADHVLAHGLQGASLRPLGTAAGTSDRMLLHYFADKDALLTATLTLVTQRLIAVLDSAQADPMPFHSLLPHLAAMLKDARIQPYLRLWLDLMPFAAGETEPFRSIARSIASTLLSWIAAALDVEREEDRASLAALTLALVEGFVIFDALGDDATRTAALAGIALGPPTGREPAAP
jgi:AcrR family transcriptional regulator